MMAYGSSDADVERKIGIDEDKRLVIRVGRCFDKTGWASAWWGLEVLV